MSTLRFPLFSVPVEISPSFWLVILVLGYQGALDTRLLLWVAVVLVSILAHELGHAMAFRRFGHVPSIRLYGMGGLTFGSQGKGLSSMQHIAVSLAGPAAGFAVGAAVYAAATSIPQLAVGMPAEVVGMMLWVNVGWGIVNLLPIQPLDGAQALASGLDLAGLDGSLWTLRLTLPLAALGMGLGYMAGSLWIAILAGLAGARAFQQLRARGLAIADTELNDEIEALWEGVRRGEDMAALVSQGQALRARARSTEVQGRLDQMVAIAALQAGDPVSADEALLTYPAGLRKPVDLQTRVIQALHNAGEFERSAESGERLFRVTKDPKHAYNVACSWSRAGQIPDAVAWLEDAVDAGWTDLRALDSDGDLAGVRSQQPWAELRRELGEKVSAAS